MFMARCVEAERHQLHPLQPHHPIGFGPAPVIADQHAEDAVKRPPHRKTEVAGLKILLFEMLKGQVWPVVGMARKMDLPIFPEDPAIRPNQYRRIVPPAVAAGFGIAEIETDAELRRQIE